MRKIILALAAVGAFGLALPMASSAKAEEGKIVIRTGDRDHHHWRHEGRRHENEGRWERWHHRGDDRRMEHRHHDRTVVIRHHDND
jgi:hypothetical protein